VRELHSLVFDALSRTTGSTLNLAPFRDLVGNSAVSDIREPGGELNLDYDGLVDLFGHFPSVKEINDVVFEAALIKADGNQSLASRLLGVNQSTLSRRISKLES
ncbi:MAG: sigma-54-dependent Fis family transcriptional regulator, partial [Spirochaetaceae bacterium]|nr:sigma-54-dependent Fis family transcriptional regulator [Spirochaetaceae bacterium]